MIFFILRFHSTESLANQLMVKIAKGDRPQAYFLKFQFVFISFMSNRIWLFTFMTTVRSFEWCLQIVYIVIVHEDYLICNSFCILLKFLKLNILFLWELIHRKNTKVQYYKSFKSHISLSTSVLVQIPLQRGIWKKRGWEYGAGAGLTRGEGGVGGGGWHFSI